MARKRRALSTDETEERREQQKRSPELNAPTDLGYPTDDGQERPAPLAPRVLHERRR